MPSQDVVVFLRDPFAGAIIASYCNQLTLVADAAENTTSMQDAIANGSFASYVLSNLVVIGVAPLEKVRAHCFMPPVYLGNAIRDVTLYLAVPLPATTFAAGTLSWARYAQAEAGRQYMGRCRIAHLQTIGGGWASLCRADKALVCAMGLYYLATQVVFDDDLASKSRLFIGWAHLWNGSISQAIALFRLELNDALSRNDIVHERRCRHAIINATTNSQLLQSVTPGAFSLTDCWTSAFTPTEMREVSEAHDAAAVGS